MFFTDSRARILEIRDCALEAVGLIGVCVRHQFACKCLENFPRRRTAHRVSSHIFADVVTKLSEVVVRAPGSNTPLTALPPMRRGEIGVLSLQRLCDSKFAKPFCFTTDSTFRDAYLANRHRKPLKRKGAKNRLRPFSMKLAPRKDVLAQTRRIFLGSCSLLCGFSVKFQLETRLTLHSDSRKRKTAKLRAGESRGAFPAKQLGYLLGWRGNLDGAEKIAALERKFAACPGKATRGSFEGARMRRVRRRRSVARAACARCVCGVASRGSAVGWSARAARTARAA